MRPEKGAGKAPQELQSLIEERGINKNADSIKKLVPNLKVIYTDLDGTLLGPGGSIFLDSHKNFTLKPAEAIVRALDQDTDITITSGRSSRQLFGDARLLGFKNYIAELGAQIVYNLGEKVILNTGDFKVTEKDLFTTIAKTGAVQLLFDAFPGCLEYHTPWSDNRECTHVFRGYIDTNKANELLAKNNLSNLKVVDNGIIHNRGTLKEGLSEIHAYHLLPASTDKPSGVRKDRNLRNFAKNECVAIGDALSDLVLASEVAVFFFVRNGLSSEADLTDEIRSYDNVFITKKEMGLGFAEAIDLLAC